MKEIYLCKVQTETKCKSQLQYQGLQTTIYFCGSHRNVNKCWGSGDWLKQWTHKEET